MSYSNLPVFGLRGLLLIGAALAASAEAATVAACGPNLCYEYDDAQAAIALTGAPTLVGDDMQFLPPAFFAHSTGAAGWNTTTANFVFSRVYTVDPLNEIAAFHTVEEFDYEIIADGEVRASVYTQARSNLNSTDGVSGVVSWADAGDTGGMQVRDLEAWLYPASGFSGPARDMRVTIQNLLRAYTDALAEDAFIQKKFILLAVTTQPGLDGNPAVVPLPGAIWLLGPALGLLGALRRLR